MKCTFAVCAEGASVDSTSNLLSIFNIIDEINSQTFPVAFPRLVVVFIVERADGDEDRNEAFITFKVNNEEKVRQPVLMDFQDKKRLRLVLQFAGIVFTEPGQVRASLVLGQEELGSWKLDIILTGGLEPKVAIS